MTDDSKTAKSDEVSLVLRMLEGDKAAFRKLLETYAPQVRGFLHRQLGHKASGETINEALSQAAFKACWTPYTFDQTHTSLGTWFTHIAFCTLVDMLCKGQNNLPASSEASQGEHTSGNLGKEPPEGRYQPLSLDEVAQKLAETEPIPLSHKEIASIMVFLISGQSDGCSSAESTLASCACIPPSKVPCRFNAPPGRQFCFWHDPDMPKNTPIAGEAVAQLVKEHGNLEAFQLEGINLQGRVLSGARLIGANLQEAHLWRANLENAHLFGVSLRGADLFKTNLSGANLRSADFTGANLLGATLKNTRLEGVELGKKNKISNELEGDEHMRRGDLAKAGKHWHEAEEIYLALLNNYREAGRNEESGELFYRLMVVNRKVKPYLSTSRWGSLFMDAICGYGERPARVVLGGILLVILSSLLFFAFTISDSNGQPIGYDEQAGLHDNIKAYGLCLYFSVITMTTTGYGDYIPLGNVRYLAAVEAFAGAFLIAVFVLVFARKMMR